MIAIFAGKPNLRKLYSLFISIFIKFQRKFALI